jgi:hypothetical protein
LVKAPTLIGRKYVIGNARPIIAAIPVNEDTGVNKPDNNIAGKKLRMAVPNSAAIWVLAKDEMNMP